MTESDKRKLENVIRNVVSAAADIDEMLTVIEAAGSEPSNELCELWQALQVADAKTNQTIMELQ